MKVKIKGGKDMTRFCNGEGICTNCKHYVFDDEREDFVCFAKPDSFGNVSFEQRYIPENKEQIVSDLLLLLRKTDNLSDLIALKYERKNDAEKVIATFANGHKKIANVSMDSGTAMICDIIKQIV